MVRERVQRYHVPDSPPIPVFRFDFDKFFNCTCLDMTGNYNIKVKDDVLKYYLVFLYAQPLAVVMLK